MNVDQLDQAIEGGGRVRVVALQMLDVCTSLEYTRAENTMPDGRRRNKQDHFLSCYTELLPGRGSVLSPLRVQFPIMASSEITDGGDLAETYRAMQYALSHEAPALALAHGQNPYGEFALYVRYVYPASRVAPPTKPRVVNSPEGVAILCSRSGDLASDPIGFLVFFKGLRRCQNCDKIPDFHRHGTFSRCKGCCEAGGPMCSWYCSKECQRQNWKHHQTACRTPRDNTQLQAQLSPY